jgi:carboxymethylenebutenolidase
MSLKTEWIRHGQYSGYFAVPEKAALPLPAVIVFQEIMGVNEHIEDVTRRIAAAGYAALAPDMYSVNGERLPPLTRERIGETFAFLQKQPPTVWSNPEARATELAKLPSGEKERIGETFGKLFGSMGKMDAFTPQMRSAFNYLVSERPETKGQKIGCVGFCMGGGLSALLSCEEPSLSAAAVFYGNAPGSDKIGQTQCPVIAFYGGNDQRVNAGIPGFAESMKQAGRKFEHHVYPGANHAFFNDTAAVYDVKAARDAFAKLLTFFSQTLAG